jgi:hypothetical protein
MYKDGSTTMPAGPVQPSCKAQAAAIFDIETGREVRSGSFATKIDHSDHFPLSPDSGGTAKSLEVRFDPKRRHHDYQKAPIEAAF